MLAATLVATLALARTPAVRHAPAVGRAVADADADELNGDADVSADNAEDNGWFFDLSDEMACDARPCGSGQAVMVDGQCWSVGVGVSCAKVCGGEGKVNIEGTRRGASVERIVSCLESHLLAEVIESNTFIEHLYIKDYTTKDEIDQDCPGMYLLIPASLRWHCFAHYSPL
eukprot:4602136-Prymnesium_polylepis.1